VVQPSGIIFLQKTATSLCKANSRAAGCYPLENHDSGTIEIEAGTVFS